MELYESSRRETRRTWALALVFVAAIFVAGAPVVQAAAQAVRVTNTPSVKIKDTSNGRINSQNIGKLGLFDAPGSNGAVDVRTFGGGGGLLAAGDCHAGSPRPATATIPASNSTVITALIITGTDATVQVDAPELDPAIGPNPVVQFRVDAGTPQTFVGLGNGLTVTPSSLVFTCVGTNGEFAVLGQ
ncbi:MAG: hypothetical protein ACRDJV_01780 [Actinomycetota bacterium]